MPGCSNSRRRRYTTGINQIVVTITGNAIQDSHNLIALIALTIVSSSGSQVCQKLAAIHGKTDTGLIVNPHVIASLALLAISLGSWLMVLARADVSVVYPLLSLNYVVVMVIARVYFGEYIPVHRWLGTLVILTGIVLLVSPDLG